ncbi:hypothetical protein HanIR_Chr02g0066361 [Helianthus annuus]|nr:hypothetical protein HanIR_Chr02g0066361 [Helianthus annuus]
MVPILNDVFGDLFDSVALLNMGLMFEYGFDVESGFHGESRFEICLNVVLVSF